MTFFFGIDGTGEANEYDYSRTFENSFVRQLSRLPNWAYKGYYRGPTGSGSETGLLAEKAANFCKIAFEQSSGPARIFLSGYSRGGAAAIEAANILQTHGVNVHSLLLFDAVQRTGTVSAQKIPSNVKIANHAMRSPESGSRIAFGNCGKLLEDYSKTLLFSENSFRCTHGGMGGVPWTTTQGVSVPEVIGVATQGLSYKTGKWATSQARSEENRKIVETGSLRVSTNVTLADELRESARVGQWMISRLSHSIQMAPEFERKGLPAYERLGNLA
ncbi:hypothetical protein [Ascidiaceihabitans sp.]|uniref:hypothetical protein n=1 Tax=Ascidiaceihabitans sp. TaxID=1872644 RepID=UPI00329A77C4